MRSSTRMKAALTAALCLCLPAVAAGQTTINFDSLTCGTPLAVSNQFAGVGVSSFSSPFCIAASLTGSSSPNLLVGDQEPNPPGGTGAAKAPISFDFSFAVPFVSIVALDVGADGLQLECFDATGGGGSSLGTDSLTGTGAGVDNTATLLVTAAGIRSCTVSQLTSAEPFDGYGIDDLMFPVELQSFSVE